MFHQRNQLRNLSLSNQAKDVEMDVEVTCDSSDVRDSAEKVCYPGILAYRRSRLPKSGLSSQTPCALCLFASQQFL